MTSGPFIIVDTAALPLFMIWLAIFQNLWDPILFLFNFCAQLLFAFTRTSFAAITGGSKCSNGQTTPLLAIDFEGVISDSYGCSTFRGEPGLTDWFLPDFFFFFFTRRDKKSIPERIHSETRTAVLEAACLKRVERGASIILDRKLSQSAFVRWNDKSCMPQIWYHSGH